MANLIITRGTTLPDSSAKSDFHNLVDQATGTISNIVNADIDSAAAIADSKLATISTANKVSVSALGTLTGLTEKVTLTGDDIFLINDSAASNAMKKVKSSTLATTYTFTPTAANALAGSVVQVVSYQTGAVATGTTVMPNDDTIPQNTEGDQYMSLAITPTSATNKLKIDVVFNWENANVQHGIALFQDSTAGALAAIQAYNSGGACNATHFTHYMTSGTTSSTTFKVRAGGASGTLTFNGVSSARKLGGTMVSSITITEIKV
jgi:hypothetical protein